MLQPEKPGPHEANMGSPGSRLVTRENQLFVKATDRPQSDEHTDKIFSVQVSDEATKQLIAPRGPFGELRMSPNGNAVSFVGSREDGPEPHDLQFLAVNGHATRNLTGASLDRP